MHRNFLTVIVFILLVSSMADDAFAQSDIRELTPSVDARALSAIFGDEFLAENARSICRRAAELDPVDRFEFLCRWVLPGVDHADFRVDGILTQTDPAPLALELEPAVHQSPQGAALVSPVFELLDVAAETGNLTELRERIAATAEPVDELQRRARMALRVLLHLELGESEQAETALTELHALADQAQPESLHELWPETLVVYRSLHRFPEDLPVGDLLTLLYSQRTMRRTTSQLDQWHTQIISLLGHVRHLEAGGSPEAFHRPADLVDWVPVVRARARSRGPGAAHARWDVSGAHEAHHVAGHQEEYLFYRLPLRGDFSVECDVGVSGTTQFLTAGQFWGAKHTLDQLENGAFRDGAMLQPFDPPFSNMRDWMHCRAVFDDGTLTVYLNGRRVHQEQLPEHHDPWIGIRSWWRNAGRFRDFRIAGTPEVPDSVLMSASPRLTGWLPYHDDQAGYIGADWQWRDDPDSSGQIVGARDDRLAGSFCESLLRYQRPLADSGSIEYEFYYEPGQVLAHPALDRLAFILEPGGVQVHWITDAAHDRTGVPPDNLIDEPRNRRGPTPLPLNSGSWNHLKLSLQESVAQVELNGQLVFERPLEPTNRRTFGLFHFADQSEVRVRNVIMRGDWADPPSPVQELADVRVAELDASRDRLPSVFTHDFRDGVPDEHFRLGNSRTRISQAPAGVRAAESSTGSWEQAAIISRFAMQGDFDVEATFDQLDTGNEGDSRVQLIVKLEGDPPRQVRCGRLRTTRRGEHLQGQLILQYPDGTNRYVDGFLPDESTAGRLRLARRDDTVTMLFAQADSPLFRVIGQQNVGDGDVPIDGIHLIAVAHHGGRSSVIWKEITLHADQLQYVAEDDKARRLYFMDADGRNLRDLFEPPGDFTHLGSPEWSADGRLITLDVSTGSTTTSHIFVVDVDSGEATDVGPGCMPSFSRDGDRIVFSHSGQGVMMMDADGSNRRVIDRSGWGVQFSPDGTQIAYGNSGNITLRNVETAKVRPLLTGDNATRYDYIYWNLGWSHDSRSIAFKARNRQTGEYEVAVAEVDSPDGLEVLYSTTGNLNADFTFSPDDRQVLFAMNTPGEPGPRLFVCDRNDSADPTPLPGQPADVKIFDCAWSSEGLITFAGQKLPQPVDWPPAE